MKIRITLLKVNMEEARLWFDTPAEVTFGRSQTCACCIDDDAMVSRMHAVVLADPPSIRIKDLNSTNGIMINGELFGGYGNEKILQARELREGDEVMIGNTVIRWALVDDDDEPDAVPEPETAVRLTGSGLGGGASRPTTQAGVSSVVTLPQSGLPSLAPAIPGYEVRTFIGSGRTGSVYKAIRLDTAEPAAIKVMYPDLPFTQKMIDTFKLGMDELKSLDHPCLVKCLASGEARTGSVYIAAEFVDGIDLAARLAHAPARAMALEEACAIFARMCSGLAHAHRQGVLHRDLRPSKVLLAESGGENEARVADIGMARVFEEICVPISGIQKQEAINLAYSAPEQLQMLREPKPSIDVFGAGAVFYEMLTGAGPYNFGNTEKPAETVARRDITPIEERAPGLPETLVVIVERCLQHDPDARYQNCGELLEALENVAF